jgi:hypothetical protein
MKHEHKVMMMERKIVEQRFDDVGHVIYRLYSDGYEQFYEYDAKGRLSWQMDSEGHGFILGWDDPTFIRRDF